MVGFKIFLCLFLNINEECRNRILGNIFLISSVSTSKVFLGNNRITFRLFDGYVFYQYVFNLASGVDKIYNDGKIVKCVYNLGNKKKVNNFIYQLSKCSQEQQVYSLIKKML